VTALTPATSLHPLDWYEEGSDLSTEREVRNDGPGHRGLHAPPPRSRASARPSTPHCRSRPADRARWPRARGVPTRHPTVAGHPELPHGGDGLDRRAADGAGRPTGRAPLDRGDGLHAELPRLRTGIRGYYRRNDPLTPVARFDAQLNPGMGWVSPLCHEPTRGAGGPVPFLASRAVEIMPRTRSEWASGGLRREPFIVQELLWHRAEPRRLEPHPRQVLPAIQVLDE
jgi:hypothetical protein